MVMFPFLIYDTWVLGLGRVLNKTNRACLHIFINLNAQVYDPHPRGQMDLRLVRDNRTVTRVKLVNVIIIEPKTSVNLSVGTRFRSFGEYSYPFSVFTFKTVYKYR